MLDDLIMFWPGQVVKVPTAAFGEEWAKEHPGKTYTGKLLGVIEWGGGNRKTKRTASHVRRRGPAAGCGRLWNVQYDRNEPPFPTGEEWFTAADADDT